MVALDCHMGSDFEFIHFPCWGHRGWSHRDNFNEVFWRIYTPMAICSDHCVLLHRFLSSCPDAVDHSNGSCVRNLVRCWNRINQPFGLVGKWAKAWFPGDRRHDPYLCRGSGYKYFFKIYPTLIRFKESRVSGALRLRCSRRRSIPCWPWARGNVTYTLTEN